MSPHLVIDRDAVRAFCQRHRVARLALFGSALRDDFGPDSDVDVLVEFQPGHVPGLNFVSMERELSGLLQGRRVDLVTPKFLNVRIREQVLRDAERSMSPRDLVYVGHMLDMARKAVAKVRDLPRETYDADENLRLALIHLVQVIGEAARQVSRDFTVTHPEVPWENIIGMGGTSGSSDSTSFGRSPVTTCHTMSSSTPR